MKKINAPKKKELISETNKIFMGTDALQYEMGGEKNFEISKWRTKFNVQNLTTM